jgi:FdrA protein
MQLQAALAEIPGVEDAGAVMGAPENLALLEASGLFSDAVPDVGPTDLLVVVRAKTASAADEALERIDDLLRREATDASASFRPRSLEAATRVLPDARWVLVSVPGRFAADVARQAIALDRHVFLYSDNVPLADEAELKRSAREKALLVLGPDCGTALIGGVGLGFANRVRRGDIGIVAASGTGLQAVACSIHALGAGISHAIGTGGRDLDTDVGAITSLQALDLLRRDAGTRVIVLLSKPPAREVADRVLEAARRTSKPVVIAFQGYEAARGGYEPSGDGSLYFASSLADAARLAVALTGREPAEPATTRTRQPTGAGLAPHLRGLFSGGTIALEAVLALRDRVEPLFSNVKADGAAALPDPWRSQGHTVVDLGADEFTVGRPHPMIDNDLRVRRLRQEAADREVGLILLDVVLGYGAHPDPAAELAPAIADALRPDLAFVTIVIGTDEDPQGVEAQIERLEDAGAAVFRDVGEAVRYSLNRLGLGGAMAESSETAGGMPGPTIADPGESATDSAAAGPPIDHLEALGVALTDLEAPGVINVGLESFRDALALQGADVVQVDWRPPADGDRRLIEILEKLRG